jgi:hypothetical protein
METKSVILVDYGKQPEQPKKKPIEITHYLNANGKWEKGAARCARIQGIAFLGVSPWKEDLFSLLDIDGHTWLCKGYYNDGIYLKA